MSHEETRENIRKAVLAQLDDLELPLPQTDKDNNDPDTPKRPRIDYGFAREWVNTALAATADGQPSLIDTRIIEANNQIAKPTDKMKIGELIKRRNAALLGRALLLDTLAHDPSIFQSASEETI